MNVEIGKVSLNVNDLERMINFYENSMGLDILEQTEASAVLGRNTALVELIALDEPSRKSKAAGLFHMAFLLPQRKDLADVMNRFEQNKVRVVNAYDHGLTEAIYLYDPELNGIEIYHDKKLEELDGQIELNEADQAEPLDESEVMALSDLNQLPGKFPKDTTMGHVHLAVSDIDKTLTFYQDVLGLTLMSSLPGKAVFFSDGEYHHQIAGNIWTSKNAEQPNGDERGLRYFEVGLDNVGEIKTRLKKADIPFEQLSDNNIAVHDFNGLKIKIISL